MEAATRQEMRFNVCVFGKYSAQGEISGKLGEIQQ